MSSLSFVKERPVSHNFVEVEADRCAHSEGPGLSSRNLEEHTLIVFHDDRLNRGSVVRCSEDVRPTPAIKQTISHMRRNWGSYPADIQVLLAGGAAHGYDFNQCLAKGLEESGLVRQPLDVRPRISRPLGRRFHWDAHRHCFYNPQTAQVEFSDEDEPGGGRLYSDSEKVAVSEL